MTRATVVLSGGQDSATCLYLARTLYDEVRAVSFRYGQRHATELDAAREIAALCGVEHRVLDVDALAQLKGGALTDHAQAVAAVGGFGGLPSTFVPMRNLVFLTLAAAWGVQVAQYDGALTPRPVDIVTGVCETDFSGYPDCRGDFLVALEPALMLAMPESARPLRLHAPLLSMTKADEVRLARDLPGCWDALALTVTCYRGERPGCGSCPACRLRARGFAEAGYTDPAA